MTDETISSFTGDERFNRTSYGMGVDPYKIWGCNFPDGTEMLVSFKDGNSFVRISHKDGSHVEFKEGGGVSHFTVGPKDEYCKSGVTFTCDQNYDCKVNGHNRLGVVGGTHIEILGHHDQVIAQDENKVIGGHTRVSILGSAYMGVNGDFLMNVKGNYTLEVQGSTTMATADTHTVLANLIDLNPGG